MRIRKLSLCLAVICLLLCAGCQGKNQAETAAVEETETVAVEETETAETESFNPDEVGDYEETDIDL